MMAQHTVIIDPVVWHTQSEDQEALKVKDIFAQHIEPALSQTQKQRLDAIKQLLTPAAQRFIFKHELGHSAANFSKKKLGVIFIVGFLATYSGITAAKLVLPINGLLAILVGMLVGGFCDLLYTYLSNATWKLRQEKNADFFAARYSSREDIQAAAHFFAHHQEVLATYREPGNLLARIPSAFTSGHQNGKARSAFLLKLAELNQ
jgi:Zn-dependent protease with chaperone function